MDSSSASLTRPSTSFRLRSSSLNTLRLRRVFDVFDGNHDNLITIDEFYQALNRLGLDSNQTDLISLVSGHIKPGKSGLDFDDFEALHRSIGDSLFGDDVDREGGGGEQEDEGDLREAFGVFDEDGDGFISAVELRTVLGKLGFGKEVSGTGKAEAMICSFDRNDDGKVDFSEFKNMMSGIVSLRSS